jgi:DUF2958 family protein
LLHNLQSRKKTARTFAAVVFFHAGSGTRHRALILDPAEEQYDAPSPLGVAIERDEHFEADKPLSAYVEDARERRRIVT